MGEAYAVGSTSREAAKRARKAEEAQHHIMMVELVAMLREKASLGTLKADLKVTDAYWAVRLRRGLKDQIAAGNKGLGEKNFTKLLEAAWPGHPDPDLPSTAKAVLRYLISVALAGGL